MRAFFWRVAPDCPPSIATRRNTPRDLPLTSKKPSVWGGADLQKFTKKLAPSKVKKYIYYTISPQKTFISRRGGLKIKIQGKGDFWPPPPHPPPLDGRWRGKTKRKEEGRERREKKGGKGSKKGVRGGHLQKKKQKKPTATATGLSHDHKIADICIHRTKSHPFLHPISHFFFFFLMFKLISKKNFFKKADIVIRKVWEGRFSSRVFRRKKGEPFPTMILATRGKQPIHPPFSMKCFWGGRGGGVGVFWASCPSPSFPPKLFPFSDRWEIWFFSWKFVFTNILSLILLILLF